MYNTVDNGSSIEIDVEDVDREALFGETLLALSESGFNQAQAAERLRIHTKTMQYRYRKLQQQMGKDLADPDVRFRIQLLAHLIEIERKEVVS